ncbi:MAG: N-6 DNA methylase [Proteobacteria bacterium]|nr:N-6 DNA methylase [Pseudomonadota bacterium]MBU4013690.1 N-6 DNA methylase [Pseudomonadota bacterium]MBU4067745.1 N-6 DNA methylase [Pseudomonadota bacterium]
MNIPDKIIKLIETFDYNLEMYKKGSYNETQVRLEFINPFFEELGWDITNKQGHAEAYKDVIHEDAIKIGGITKAPDYCFRIGGVRKFFLEAKKPSVNIKEDIHPAYQLRRYGWSAKLPLSILTDFEEFAVYDCRVKPAKTDKVSHSRILYMKYTDYIERWDEIVNIFSPKAILKGSFDKYAELKKTKKGTAEVDKAFLAEIERWRELLARNIALRNPDLNQRELNFAVQQTIDRIVFLRICEDRGIENYGRLMALQNGNNVYRRLFQLFRKADDKYNSGLFHFKKEKSRENFDNLTPNLIVDDKELKSIFKNLYYPDSPYEFSVLPADILGQVYEQFLGKIIRLTSNHRAIIEEKPEVRKAGGVYYTPTYIVDYIVKQTIEKLVENKKPGQRGAVSKLKILDPACGSGSFLLGAYQYLLDWHRDQYVNDDPEKWAKGRTPRLYQTDKEEWRLTTDERKRILLNNIYGVDIDPQAVEVTKLSLLLKVLEGENEQSIGKQMALFQERVLPDLSNNIKCGNSLIGPDFHENQQMSLLDEEEIYRVNAFDWNAEFAKIMKDGGFDVVIGNPPYIFTRELISEYEKEYYNRAYQQTQFKINTYLLFVERGFWLLKDIGRFGYIIPNNWLTLETASLFRHFILSKTRYLHIVNSRDKVFESASVDTSILIFSKSGKANLAILELENGEFKPILNSSPKIYLNLHSHIINYEVHKSDECVALCQKISHQGTLLEVIAEVRNGIQAYTVGEGAPIQTEQMKKDRVYHSFEKKDHTWVKYVDGVDVGRYKIGWSQQYVKYGKNLTRPRKKELFQGERLLIRQIPALPPYSILASYVDEELVNDNNSMIVTQPKIEYSLKYLAGILNSRLISFWFVHSFGKLQRKVFPQFKVKELRIFPIRPIDFTNPADVARHDQIVSLVDQMLELNKKLGESKMPQTTEMLKRQIESTDRQIDQLVYKLYDLTNEEIKIVESET